MVIKKFPGRLLAALLAVAMGWAIIACEPRSGQPESTDFTADEVYLIDAYVQVALARSHYPHDFAAAESLFAELSATVDTVRIARTIDLLSQTPDRWAAVYGEIEERMRETARERDLEGAGAGAGTPAKVE